MIGGNLNKKAKGNTEKKLEIVSGNRIALTPAMGWNSWNCFASEVSADKVKRAADAMVVSGLVNHGWSYINVGCCISSLHPNLKIK